MKRQKLVPVVVGLLVVLIGVLIFLSGKETQPSVTKVYDPKPKSSPENTELAEGRDAPPTFRAWSRGDQVEPNVVDASSPVLTAPPTPVADSPGDEALEAEEVEVSRETWTDPVNQKVLGDRRWMPEPSPEESEHIESVLNSPMPQTRQGVESRATSITDMKTQIDRCLSQFPTGGRIIVIWELEGNGRLAISRDVRLGPVFDVQDSRFLDCVTGFVPPPSPTQEIFKMTVEYPAFLDAAQVE